MAAQTLTYVFEVRENGQLMYEQYWLDDKLHNPNGPAYREWHENGKLWGEQYWLDDKRHNPHGPASRSWYPNGRLAYEEYWLNGKNLTKSEWEAAVNPKSSCSDKIVEIDGKRYKLVEVA